MQRQAAIALLICGLGCAAASAQSLGRDFVPGMRQADRHNPFSPGYVDMLPGSYARRSGYGGLYYSQGSYFFGTSPGPFGYDPWWPGYGGYGYGYGPYLDGYGYGYGFDIAPYSYGYAQFGVYPLIVPGEQFFLGPAIRGFLQNAEARAAANQPPVVIVPPDAGNGVANPPAAKLRASNAETLLLATKVIGFGDEHFKHQRYREALDRYRKATETAPDLVEAYFRHGQALAALGKYDVAAAAFKRGMRLSADWPEADFKLRELYGNNQLAQQSHLEAVAGAASMQPADGDLLLIVALQLYFGDQQARALPIFKKAEERLADARLHLDALQAPAAPAQQAGQRAGF
jgi:tetratricopeptide (TPR) repeat protein